ncbi:MAG TPA: ATP-binding protein, partial [Longimicrobiaceae bacterium]|nr:ATP-binding protein [Longimicrobiaceae bacterium]
EGVPVSFEQHYPRSGTWVEIRAYPLPSGGTVAVWKDVTERRRADEALHYLSESSAILASSLDYHTTLSAVARLMVPQLADWCSVEVMNEHGRLEPVALAHVDPAKTEWAREFTRRYPADPNAATGAYQVVRTGKPDLIETVTDEMLQAAARDEEHLRIARELGLVSAMTVPLTARGHTLGVLSLVAAESGRHYTEEDLSLAMEVAQRAAIAVDNARLHHESEEARERLEEQASELEMQAEELQSQASQLEEVQAELEMSNEELRTANEHLSEETSAAEEARREAEAANRAKSSFLANMSHELRTPLNAILGYTDLLEIGVPEPVPANAHQQVERIGRASRHLLSVIEEILTFSRIDAGRETAATEEVDLTELTGEVNAIIEPLAAAKGLRFNAPAHLPEGTLCTDPRKLRQILINLLGNAVKFTTDGEVGLEVEFSPTQAEFRVCDTGVGIAAENQESIFEPFRQVDDRRTRSAEGTGLGLAVSRRLARLLGGDVTVSSEEGEGSVFHLTLPRE